MSTRSVADEIKLKAPNWPQEGNPSILMQMQRAQDFLYSKPCNRSLYVDPSIGTHPYLVTTDTVFGYDIPDISMVIQGTARTIRIFRVEEIYMDRSFLTDYGRYDSENLLPIGWASIEPDRITMKVTGTEALENTPANISFQYNPGTETEKFRMKAVIEPLRLTALAIPLMVSRNWEQAIIDGALGFIEYHDYGRSDRMQTFYDYWAPRFWQEQNRNPDHKRVKATSIRRC